MAIRFTDLEILELINERKILPASFNSKSQLKDKQGHKEREVDLKGEYGNDFRVIFRQSLFNVLDFSIILATFQTNSSLPFRLCRYNGKSHQHSNLIEKISFYNFHIHKATERYQDLGSREDAYAEETEKYFDYLSAYQCFLSDVNLIDLEQKPTLFGEPIHDN